MQKNKLFAAILMAAIAGSAIYYFSHRPKAKVSDNRQGEPQQSVEEILAERTRQASKQLVTPLGKALSERNWAQVQSIYKPETDFVSLGEIIRALYMENKMREFKPEDHEKLLELVLSTFEKLPEKSLHLTGILISQFDRLPSPKHGSANFKTLKTWINSGKETPLLKRLGIDKLVLHDAEPDTEATEVFKKMLLSGDTLGESRSEWIQKIDEIRNHALQLSCVEILSKNFKKIPGNSQPAALFVMSHHLDIRADETKTLTLQFLQSEEQGKFESALRSLTPFINEKRLKDGEKEEIVKRLTEIPVAMKTPFVELKSKEILNLLGHT